MEKFVVGYGKVQICTDRYINEDDGEPREIWEEKFLISFRSAYGEEYILRQYFDMDDEKLAIKTSSRVQDRLDMYGLMGIHLKYWNVRTIYGSQAYIDDEPYIFEREKADSLM